MIIEFLMLVLEKNQAAGLASAKIGRMNIRKGYKDYHKKLPTKAAIVVIRRCFIFLQRSILLPAFTAVLADEVGDFIISSPI